MLEGLHVSCLAFRSASTVCSCKRPLQRITKAPACTFPLYASTSLTFQRAETNVALSCTLPSEMVHERGGNSTAHICGTFNPRTSILAKARAAPQRSSVTARHHEQLDRIRSSTRERTSPGGWSITRRDTPFSVRLRIALCAT